MEIHKEIKPIIELKGVKYHAPVPFLAMHIDIIARVGIDNKVLICAELLGAPIKVLNELTEVELDSIFKVTLAQYSVMGECEHSVKFNELSFGNFVDLDILSIKGLENFSQISEILTGDKDAKYQPASTFMKLFKDWIAYRKKIYKGFDGLFNSSTPSMEDEDIDQSLIDNTETASRGWYDMIQILADGKFLNQDSVTERPHIEAFNWLAWKKDQLNKEKLRLQKLHRNKR